MGASIYPVELGMDHCYVISDKGAIMVDGGSPKKEKAFLKALEKIPVQARGIKLLVLTHGHFDHIACARKIKEITGAKIAIHHREREWLEKSLEAHAPGSDPMGEHLCRHPDHFPALHPHSAGTGRYPHRRRRAFVA